VTRQLAFATATTATGFGPILFAGRPTQAVRVAAELGYGGVEVHVKTPREYAESGLDEALREHGVRLAAVASGRIFSDDGYSLSDPDPERRAEAARRLNDLIDVAGEHGAVLIIGLLRGVRLVDDDAERTVDLLAETLAACADHAATRGVDIVLEAINRYETKLLQTAAETVAVIESIGGDNVGVLLDTFHMNIEEVSPAAAIRATGPHLRHFHVADSNRWAPGSGHIDFGEILTALDDIEYEGWISAEILPLPDDGSAAHAAIAHISDLDAHRRQ